MKRCSASLIVREMQVKKSNEISFSHHLGGRSSKTETIKCLRGCGKLEACVLRGGSGTAAIGNSTAVSQNINNRTAITIQQAHV